TELLEHGNRRRTFTRRERGDVVPDRFADCQLTRHLETPDIELGIELGSHIRTTRASGPAKSRPLAGTFPRRPTAQVYKRTPSTRPCFSPNGYPPAMRLAVGTR